MKTKFTLMWLLLMVALTPIPALAQEGAVPVGYRITVENVIPYNFSEKWSVSIILPDKNRINGTVADFQNAYLDRNGGVLLQVEVKRSVPRCQRLSPNVIDCRKNRRDVDITPYRGTRLSMMYYPTKCQLVALGATGSVSNSGRLENGHCLTLIAVRGTEGAQAAIHVFVESQLTVSPYGSPHGGEGGDAFRDTPPYSSQVVGLYIRYGDFVDAIKMLYNNVDLPKHGGDGGGETTITFEPGEYITAIYGRSGAFLDSLTIETNIGRRFGPFGGLGGDPFEVRAPAGYEIAGFFGRAGVYVDAIGAVIRLR